MDITVLGEARYPSPLNYHVSDKARVPFTVVVDPDAPPADAPTTEPPSTGDDIDF